MEDLTPLVVLNIGGDWVVSACLLESEKACDDDSFVVLALTVENLHVTAQSGENGNLHAR